MPQHEGDGLHFAEVGEPIPGEHALDTDHQTVAEGTDGFKERFGAGGQVLLETGLALVIKNVQEQTPCMQVAAGVKSVLLVVKTHGHGLRRDGPP
jgi:hypothetical protein